MSKNEKIYDNAFQMVKDLTNEELRNLLIETHEISNVQAPATAKQSKLMKKLFALEKADYKYWTDIFHNVSSAISHETLFRVRTNQL